ncbi:MAG: MFS transporter [Neomegalonema sp.]|nr:MFS transporter [Neomegalonema sp.]
MPHSSSPPDLKPAPLAPPLAERLYHWLSPTARKDADSALPEAARARQPQNFVIHLSALGLNKIADTLINPKLVLSWLLTVAGASGFVGLLVPVREAGSLLPQLFIAGPINRLSQRKWAWSAGALVEGACALGIAIAALSLQGAALGWAVIGLLTLLALARSVCSVAYKDVLARTIAKQGRGSVTGAAGSLAAIGALIFALLLLSGIADREPLVIGGLIGAGIAWIGAGIVLSRLTEPPRTDPKPARESWRAMARAYLGALREDHQLRIFIRTRALLIGTALAPPYMLALFARGDEGAHASGLGLLLIGAAAAEFASGYVWGRLADHSSRRVMQGAGALGCLCLVLTLLAQAMGWLSLPGVLAGLIFLILIAHNGVRLGRSIHLVDMAPEGQRTFYTSLSNTVIGAILLGASVLSLLAQFWGEGAVLAVLALMTLAASLSALGLEEVQQQRH